MKILIVGIGGVGGYYGGMLARKYAGDKEIEIDFLARGEHLRVIKKNGLTVQAETETFITRPVIVTDKPNEIGIVDYIIIATKSYDLENTIHQIQPCIGKNTVILPLLNGALISQNIREMLPDTEVWEGCTYIVGRRTAPGTIASTGNVHDVFFGYRNKTTDRLLQMETILQNAGIEAVFSKDIIAVIWRKFFFISTTASLTSYFDCSFGALLSDAQRKQTLLSMLHEILLVSQADGAKTDSSFIDKTVAWIERLPFETTSSMHTDFTNHHQTEVENLTGTVIRLAQKHNVEVPVYQKIYAALKLKANE